MFDKDNAPAHPAHKPIFRQWLHNIIQITIRWFKFPTSHCARQNAQFASSCILNFQYFLYEGFSKPKTLCHNMQNITQNRDA